MRLIFMGTPDFAVPALAALVDAGHDVVCVYSQPPRPSGRGHREQPSPVQKYAQAQGIDVRYPVSLKAADAQADFAALNADAAVVAAYGLILPKAILDAPALGCLNIHASLLPRWRGAAPIQRAILAGDTETGVTIMQMDEGLDTGPVLMTGKFPIGNETTASDVHDALAALGRELIVQVLSADLPTPEPQPGDGSTYAPKLDRAEGRIDWTESAATLDLKIRALNPWPGVWCERDDARLRVLAATPVPGSGEPGTVIDAPLTVACGGGALRLDRVQRADKSAMSADEYARGNPVPAGTVLQ
ncbi:MAG: methionyl-tRNA formyltransferase [Alphaproteobacteria bacterium]|jgi:methionyl-tRNA formyltransferase|nr:methionyl-tRNA formyltransferase [Alphaproteobacteria bacterium]